MFLRQTYTSYSLVVFMPTLPVMADKAPKRDKPQPPPPLPEPPEPPKRQPTGEPAVPGSGLDKESFVPRWMKK